MVISRPTGHKLIDQAISATIINSEPFDSGNSALVNFTSHGLSTGDFVYVESDIDEYNGFWEVEEFNANAFYLTDGANRVEFYQEIDVDYYQTQEHDWSSIFLPIVYKVTNELWPINTVDAERTVSSSADDNGFTDLTLSGSLRGTVNALEFVKISGADDDDLNGVWQIVEVINTSHVVINLQYDDDNDFTGATVQYYYNNLQQKVKIYAGLPADHPWEYKKPFEEVAELSLTPDENNEVMFSISDYIQSKVKIENNLTLYSLPLNLDAFTGFYIATGVTYDQSDNYSLYTTTALYQTDEFTGYAIAGKLPFKNVYSGDYADYVYTSGSPALWLTNRDRLLGVEGYFFDVSFIKNVIGAFYVTIKKYLSSDYYIEETLSFDDFGIGVYRIPLELNASYNAWCIRASTEDRTEEVEVFPDADNIGLYQNTAFGSDNPDWVFQIFANSMSVEVLDDFASEKAYRSMSVANGATLRVNYIIDVTFNNTHPPPVNIVIRFVLSSTPNAFTDENTVTYVVTIIGSGSTRLEGSVNVVATAARDYFGVAVVCGAEECEVVVQYISFGDPTTEEVEVPGVQITEELCIDILEACDVEAGFVSTEGRRLTEDGGYRLLE